MHAAAELNFVVDGLSSTVTESDIVTLFSSCGTVKSVEIVMDGDGIPLGIARVTMSTKEEARVAVLTYHRCRFRDRTLLVFADTTMNRREDLWKARLFKQQ